jgi:hypothetical protein
MRQVVGARHECDQPDAALRGFCSRCALSRSRFPDVLTEILATFVIGSVYFAVALDRFRRVIFSG